MALIAGVDEAGRGPLAGPVAAAAVILPEDHSIAELNDSKKLSPKKREMLYDQIMNQALAVGIGTVDEKTIDHVNILNGTYKAMHIALGDLDVQPDHALIDGFALPDQIIPNKGIIKGDEKIEVIQAASIIAKVTRDRIMDKYDVIFPEYGFFSNKGYGTLKHMNALTKWKATPIHRKSFKPVRDNFPTISWYRKHRRIGWIGEKLAALFLMKKCYEIKSMNEYCAPYGELDLIAEKNDEIVFVEVKTVSKEQLGSPELKIDTEKISKLEKSIDSYLMKNDITKDIRLDIITVFLRKGRPIINHYKGIDIC